LIVLLLGQISPQKAIQAVDMNVILFLIGVFIIGQALEQSGYLSHISFILFNRSKNVSQLVMLIILGASLSSALLLNDTIAIVGTPVCIALAKHHKIDPKLLLFALAFSITLGSVPSPIGNPQNLIIALNSNIQNPFVEFASKLVIPTILNLIATYLVLYLFFKDQFKLQINCHEKAKIEDSELAFLSKIALILMIALIMIKIVFVYIHIDFEILMIGLVSCLPILIFSKKRIEIIKKIDWPTILFFISMFILMQAVWDTGLFDANLVDKNMITNEFIMMISIVLSQFISNVPLVALYVPILVENMVSTNTMLALAAASTIAGNLTILGAASNVIIVQNAENKNYNAFGFFEFAKIGFVITIINAIIYLVFLSY